MDSTVAAVESFKILGTTISQDLKWDTHIDSIVKKAQQRLYFLRQLKKFNLPQAHMTVLLSCYWVGSVLLYNCLVLVSQQIRHKKTAADCQDSWEDNWCAPPQPSGLVQLQSEETGRVTSSQTPLTPDKTCLHFSPKADATDLCALEHLGIKTVFFPPCHLQPKQLTQELLPVFCNSCL